MNFNNASSSDEDEDEAPRVVSRGEWRARPARRVIQLPEPPSHVVYSETETKSCSTKAECIQVIQDIQNYQLDVKELQDIQYHFMIGGDGNVYEGRGWNHAGVFSTKDPRFPQGSQGHVLEIGFIGDFKDKGPPKEMLELASRLLHYGIDNNKIIVDNAKNKSPNLTVHDVNRLKQEGYNVKVFEPEIRKITKSEEEIKEKDEGN